MMRLSIYSIVLCVVGICLDLNAVQASANTRGSNPWAIMECVRKKLPSQLTTSHDSDRLPSTESIRDPEIVRLVQLLEVEVKESLREAAKLTWPNERSFRSVSDNEFDVLVSTFFENLGARLEERYRLGGCGDRHSVGMAAATMASNWFYSVLPSSQDDPSLEMKSRSATAVVLSAGALLAGYDDAFATLTKRDRP